LQRGDLNQSFRCWL